MKQLSDKLLHSDILTNLHVHLSKKGEFSIPVALQDVTYESLQREPMDVLMKMVLITLTKLKIAKPQRISDILHVEPLFISDMLQLLERQKLIEYERFYTLTALGEAQLAAGIFERVLEPAQQTLCYSPLHQTFIKLSANQIEENENLPELLEENIEIGELTQQQYIAALQRVAKSDSIITSATCVSSMEYDIPCLYFALHDKKEDSYYTRVYNVLLGEWDAVMEEKLTKEWQGEIKKGVIHNVD